MSSDSLEAKIVLLGNPSVGKSSIMLRFVAERFKTSGQSTIGGTFMSKTIQMGGKSIKFNIWDTAGQERFSNLVTTYYRDAEAAILVYDVTQADSFQGMKRWYSLLQENGREDVIVIVAGNKEDLVDQEEVDPITARQYCESIGANFFKTSAKTNYGVDQIFQCLAEKVSPDLHNFSNKARQNSVRVDNENKGRKKKTSCC